MNVNNQEISEMIMLVFELNAKICKTKGGRRRRVAEEDEDLKESVLLS